MSYTVELFSCAHQYELRFFSMSFFFGFTLKFYAPVSSFEHTFCLLGRWSDRGGCKE